MPSRISPNDCVRASVLSHACVMTPIDAATDASNFSPVRKYRPAPRAVIFGTSTSEITDGARPSRASVSAKVLFGPASAISVAPSRPKPPALTCPSTCAITGLGSSRIVRINSTIDDVASADASSAEAPRLSASPRSAPAQKVPPACVSTTARTLSSVAALVSPDDSWVTSARLNALRLPGESSVSVMTPASIPTCTTSLSVVVIDLRLPVVLGQSWSAVVGLG